MKEKLVNSVSILQICDDSGIDLHTAEQEKTLSAVDFGEGYFAYIVPVEGKRSRMPYGFTVLRDLSDVYDMLESMDIKNGCDLYETENGYKFRVYGQSWSADGITWSTAVSDLVINRSAIRYYR
jgi:hypothetical protein